MKLTEIICRCLDDHGELTGKDIAKILGVPQKAVNVALGHLRRQGRVIRLPEEEGIETPYGRYTPRSRVHKWKLRREVRK